MTASFTRTSGKRVIRQKTRGWTFPACAPRCSSAAVSVGYLGWDGSIQGFHFTSRSYAARFAGANARALVNVGADLRQLLASVSATPTVAALPSGTPRPRKTESPREAAPARESAPRDVASEWIARIEGYKACRSTPAKAGWSVRSVAQGESGAKTPEHTVGASRMTPLCV